MSECGDRLGREQNASARRGRAARTNETEQVSRLVLGQEVSEVRLVVEIVLLELSAAPWDAAWLQCTQFDGFCMLCARSGVRELTIRLSVQFLQLPGQAVLAWTPTT